MPAVVNPRFNISSTPAVISRLMRCKDKYTHKELNALIKPLQGARRKTMKFLDRFLCMPKAEVRGFKDIRGRQRKELRRM